MKTNKKSSTTMKRHNANDNLVTLIAGFYAKMYGQQIGNRDYRAEMVSLFKRLHGRAFPRYEFDLEQFLAQAKAQLFGNELTVRNYRTVTFRFTPGAGDGSPLVIQMGATSSPTKPNGDLGIWAEDPAINQRIQSILDAEREAQ